jgi:hypothetical protein
LGWRRNATPGRTGRADGRSKRYLDSVINKRLLLAGGITTITTAGAGAPEKLAAAAAPVRETLELAADQTPHGAAASGEK